MGFRSIEHSGVKRNDRVAGKYVWKVVCRDTGFTTDADKVNAREILKAAGLDDAAFVTV